MYLHYNYTRRTHIGVLWMCVRSVEITLPPPSLWSCERSERLVKIKKLYPYVILVNYIYKLGYNQKIKS